MKQYLLSIKVLPELLVINLSRLLNSQGGLCLISVTFEAIELLLVLHLLRSLLLHVLLHLVCGGEGERLLS